MYFGDVNAAVSRLVRGSRRHKNMRSTSAFLEIVRSDKPQQLGTDLILLSMRSQLTAFVRQWLYKVTAKSCKISKIHLLILNSSAALINNYITTSWQRLSSNNKPHSIEPDVKVTKTYCLPRRDKYRLSIGHTYLTHGFQLRIHYNALAAPDSGTRSFELS